VDVLRRAGIQVTFAGVNGDQALLCSRNVKILPDVSLASVKDQIFDAVVLPGGADAAKEFATVSLLFLFYFKFIYFILFQIKKFIKIE
jgi:protein DJ-1